MHYKNNDTDQITKAAYRVDSIEEINDAVKDFPEDPALNKTYADILVKKKSIDNAALYYGKAAELYLKSKKLLPAVLTKLLQWRIRSPAYQNVQLFLTTIKDYSLPDTPLKIFFEKLSKAEIIAVMKCIENIEFSAGELIYKIGDVQQNLYFILSGRVKEMRYEPIENGPEKVFKQSAEILSNDDTFGELYPIKEENICKSYFEVTKPVELLKLSRHKVMSICEKYPNVESGLKAVSAFRSEFRKTNLLKKNRKNQRHEIMIKMFLEIYPHLSGNHPIILGAYSKDISIGGTCLVLDSNDVGVTKSVTSFSRIVKNSKVRISFHSEGMELRISGKITWTHEIVDRGKRTLEVGVQFQNLSPKLRGMLFVFAENSINR